MFMLFSLYVSFICLLVLFHFIVYYYVPTLSKLLDRYRDFDFSYHFKDVCAPTEALLYYGDKF